MSDHTQSGWVTAVRKIDGAKFRLPRHIVDMTDGLELAPTQRAADRKRVTEPAKTTTTTATSKKTTNVKES